MKDEEKIALEAYHNAFSKTSDFKHSLLFCLRQGRHHGTQQERARQLNSVKPRTHNSRLKLLNIDNDVRELRHQQILCSSLTSSQASRSNFLEKYRQIAN